MTDMIPHMWTQRDTDHQVRGIRKSLEEKVPEMCRSSEAQRKRSGVEYSRQRGPREQVKTEEGQLWEKL